MILDGFTVRDITSHSAILEFPAGDGVLPADLMVVYRRDTASDDGTPKTEWVVMKNVSGKRVGRIIQLKLKNLPAQTLLSIRLLGPPEAGNRRMALIQRDILTLPDGDFHWLRAGGVLMCLGVLFWLIRRQRGY
jgi:hypothetical protein